MDSIKSVILKIFPEMENLLLDQLLDHVKEIGAETAADLKFLEAQDFDGILKPIQARKFLKSVHLAADKPQIEDSSLSGKCEEADLAVTTKSIEIPGTSAISDGVNKKIEHVCVNNVPVNTVGKPWPTVYTFPEHLLRQDILQRLNQGEGKCDRGIKRSIISVLFDDLMMYRTYPTPEMYVMAAKSLVCRFPSLQDTNPCSKPYDSWKLALSEKFRNERRNMALPSVVKRRRSIPAGGPLLKRAMKNWTTSRPTGEDDVSITNHKVWLQTEMKKSRNRDEGKMKHLMQLTFADRRKMVQDNHKIKEIKKEFPALFQTDQIHSEFAMLVDNQHLEDTFIGKMKKILMKVVEWPFSKKEDCEMAAKAKKLSKDDKDSDALLVAGAYLLPRVLLEKPTDIFVEGGQRFAEAGVIPSTPMIIYSGDIFTTSDFVIMTENEVICRPLSLYTSLLTLLGTYYCFNLEYASKTKRTLEFLQKVGLSLVDGKLSPRVASVHAKLV